MKNYYILILLLTLANFSCCSYSQRCGDIPVSEITDIYTPYVDQWKNEAKVAFEDAEAKILSVKPKPDNIVGPNPDAAKCICQGTGIIVQGDGHKTVCPYHGSKSFNQNQRK